MEAATVLCDLAARESAALVHARDLLNHLRFYRQGLEAWKTLINLAASGSESEELSLSCDDTDDTTLPSWQNGGKCYRWA